MSSIMHTDTIFMSQASIDVIKERNRQLDALGENFSHENDDLYTNGDLALVASLVADPRNELRQEAPLRWPWADHWWKKFKSRRDMLVKAAALLIAEAIVTGKQIGRAHV